MPRLVILRGPNAGRAFEIRKRADIGRLSTNDIQLLSDKVSRHHARIVCENGAYKVVDLDSRNGVAVNGTQVQNKALESGDQIEIGNALLLFELDESEDFPTAELAAEHDELADEEFPQKLPNGEAVFFSEDAHASAEHFERSVNVAVNEGDAEILLEKLREANRQLKALHDVSDAIHETFDLRELMHKVLELVLDIFDADRAVILLYSAPDGKLKPAAARNRQKTTARLAVSQTVVDYVASKMKSVISADALSDPRFDPSDSIMLQQISSVMCVPLTSKQKCQGVLYVDNRRGEGRFHQKHLRLLTIIARQAATAIDNARSFNDLRQEREELKRQVTEKYCIVGESPRLQEVLDNVRDVARGDATVLISGETGVGKELVARSVHEESLRSNGPFVVVNCASVPDNLLESELFGHEKGSFTGADRRKRGKFEMAHNGTIFLDEIAEVDLPIQTKLLRAVEQKEFDRVGGTSPVSVDVRIVAATNRNIEDMVREGTFRQDLYYRLAVVSIKVPPLRERREDIPLLCEYFLDTIGREIGKIPPRLSEGATKVLTAYNWPGNIRELRNAMERAILFNRTGMVEAEDVQLLADHVDTERLAEEQLFPLDQAVQVLEIKAIARALSEADGVKSRAAELLGISRPTLDKKLKDYASFLPPLS